MAGNFSKIAFLSLLIFLCSSFLFAQEVLDLEQALVVALAHNRMIESSKLDTAKTTDQMKAARTRYYPQFSISLLASSLLTTVDFTFQKGAFGEYPGIGPIPDKDTNITTPKSLTGILVGSVQQPLTQLYKVKLNTELIKASAEEAKEAERSQRQLIVSQVKKLYFGILQSQSAYQFAEESLKMYQELDRVTDNYVIQQVALKSDGLQVKAKLAKSEYDSLVAKNDLSTRKEQLNELMGRDVRAEFEVKPVPEETLFEQDLEMAQQVAMKKNPEIQKALWQQKQAEYDRRIKKAEYLPDVSLSLNYLSPINYEFVPSVIASYGLYFSWDVWDWGRKGHELAEKEKTIQQARLAVIETQNKVLIDINEQFRNVQESRKLIAVTKLSQDAAQENLRVVTNKFKEQSVLFKDVAQAQASLEETRDQYERALLSFWSARADFEKSLGED
jgi:outer membrane protein